MRRQLPSGRIWPAGAHHRPRDIEGTQSGRVCLLRNVTNPLRSNLFRGWQADREEG